MLKQNVDCLLLKATRREGVAKKSGEAYDMRFISFLDEDGDVYELKASKEVPLEVYGRKSEKVTLSLETRPWHDSAGRSTVSLQVVGVRFRE